MKGKLFGLGALVLFWGCTAISTAPVEPPLPADRSLFTSLAVDGEGNLYAAGYVEGLISVDFGHGVVVTGSNSSSSAFLIKFNANHEPLWVRTQTDAEQAQFNAVWADSTAVYVAGIVGGPKAGWGAGVETPGDAPRAVVVKYDPNGTAQWARCPTPQSRTRSLFTALTVDSMGNLYLAGSFRRTGPPLSGGLDFGGEVRVAAGAGAGNLLLVKYDPNGTALWARTQVNAGEDNPNPQFIFQSIALDPAGNLYAAGTIEARSTIDFGDGVTVHGNGTFYGNAVLVKYDAEGKTLWARTQAAGADSAEYLSAVADSTGVYLGGDAFDAPIGFGNGVSLPGTGSSNGVVLLLVKYDLGGQAVWARTQEAGTNNSLTLLRSVALGDGSVYGAGATGSAFLDLGAGVTVNGLVTTKDQRNLLFVRYTLEGVAQSVHSVPGRSGTSSYSSLGINPGTNGVYAAGLVEGPGELNPDAGTVISRPNGPGTNPLLVEY